MKRIFSLGVSLIMIFSFVIGAIAGSNEDVFAEAVLSEKAELSLEKAALEFANGNDVEGLALEDDATNNFGKTKLGFLRISGAVITASWCPGLYTPYRPHKPYCSICFAVQDI
jgi:hypothetical protein